MEMQVRGWREEHTAWTTDTTGQAVPVVTGLTTDRYGKVVAALAIGNGPTAIFRFAPDDGSFLADLRVNLARTVEDHEDAIRQAGQ